MPSPQPKALKELKSQAGREPPPGREPHRPSGGRANTPQPFSGREIGGDAAPSFISGCPGLRLGVPSDLTSSFERGPPPRHRPAEDVARRGDIQPTTIGQQSHKPWLSRESAQWLRHA